MIAFSYLFVSCLLLSLAALIRIYLQYYYCFYLFFSLLSLSSAALIRIYSIIIA